MDDETWRTPVDELYPDEYDPVHEPCGHPASDHVTVVYRHHDLTICPVPLTCARCAAPWTVEHGHLIQGVTCYWLGHKPSEAVPTERFRAEWAREAGR